MALDTSRGALDDHANVESTAVSCPSIPLFLPDDTSHEAKCREVNEASDDYEILLTHSIHSDL